MQIVGVDFGTSNVRIATWDSESQPFPVSVRIGPDDALTMPAVIAFRRDAPPVVGQDADGLTDNADTVVVRNIKRWALSSDPYVRLHLQVKQVPEPGWWDPETRCVATPWGESFPVWDVVRQILQEAFRRTGPRLAELGGPFQWRAGCPVQAGLEYRSELARVLSEFGKGNAVTSVVEEPVLFLVLARRLEALRPGNSYLVYDLGGGSFDSALAEVSNDGRMTVYASQGNPTLGGSLIDELLTERLGYTGSPSLLRVAKEGLQDNPTSPLDNGTLSSSDLENALKEDLFLEKTHVAMREAYISAKVVWKYDANAPTLGYSLLPSCRLEQLPTAFAKDLDAVILCGGPSKSPYIRARMKEFFGDTSVVAAEDLIPIEIPDPELTGLSIGACYAAGENYNPTYIRRLPARTSLTDTITGDRQEYEPYQHFSYPNVFDPEVPFRSLPLLLPPDADPNGRYELIVAGLDGEIYASKVVDWKSAHSAHQPRSVYLIIDRFGQIGIQVSGHQWNAGKYREITSRWIEFESLPPQIGWQVEASYSPSEGQQAYQERVWGRERIPIVSLVDWRDPSNRAIGGRVSD